MSITSKDNVNKKDKLDICEYVQTSIGIVTFPGLNRIWAHMLLYAKYL